MQSATRRLALESAAQHIRQIRQGVVLLSLFAVLTLLVLVGAGVSRAHSAAQPSGPSAIMPQPSDPEPGLAATGDGVAATNGDIHVNGDIAAPTGVQLAASNGDLVIGSTVVAPIGGQTAATNGNIHVGE